jgi:hypothetical protein
MSGGRDLSLPESRQGAISEAAEEVEIGLRLEKTYRFNFDLSPFHKFRYIYGHSHCPEIDFFSSLFSPVVPIPYGWAFSP